MRTQGVHLAGDVVDTVKDTGARLVDQSLKLAGTGEVQVSGETDVAVPQAGPEFDRSLWCVYMNACLHATQARRLWTTA